MKLIEAFAEIRIDDRKLKAGLAGAVTRSKGAATKIQRAFSVINFKNLLVGTFGIYALQRVLKTIITPAVAFESQLAMVSTMLDKTAMDILPKYEIGLKKLSLKFGESTDTLSKGLYDILSASIAPTKALKVLEISAKAATAGLTDTGVAADAITTIINAYGLAAKDAGSVSDLLFAIVKKGKTTFAELAPAIGKVATLAAKSNIVMEELAATISMITRAGIRTDEAMTAVSGMLRAFLTPQEKAIEAVKQFGFELSTTTLETIGFRGVAEKLTRATQEQLAVIFGNIRGLKGVITSLSDAKKFAEEYEFMLNRLGMTEEAYQKIADTTAFQLNRLKELYNLLKVTIGEHFLPDITKIAENTIKWYEANKKLVDVKIEEWVNRTKETIENLWPAVKTLAGWIGTVVTGWEELIKLREELKKPAGKAGIEIALIAIARGKREKEFPGILELNAFTRKLQEDVEAGILGWPELLIERPERVRGPRRGTEEAVEKVVEIIKKAETKKTSIVKNQVGIRSELEWGLTKDLKRHSELRMVQRKMESEFEKQLMEEMASRMYTLADKWNAVTKDIISNFPLIQDQMRYFSQDILANWSRTFDLMSYRVLTFKTFFERFLMDIVSAFSKSAGEMAAQALFEKAVELPIIKSVLGWVEGKIPSEGTSKIARGGDTYIRVDAATEEYIASKILDSQENFGVMRG